MPRGRPKHEPTDQQRSEVRALASFGVPHDKVAGYVGIDKKTLYKHYRDELDLSATRANATVAKYLFRAASGSAAQDGASHADCIRAAMFWAKTRMDWSEKSVHEITGKDGGPVEIKGIDVSFKSPEG